MPTYTQIGTAQVVGLLGASSIDFTAIPATYTDLVLKVSIRSNQVSGNDFIKLRFNSDTGSNYSYRRLYGTGSAVGSDNSGGAVSSAVSAYISTTGDTANTFGNGEFYIPNYTGSTYKSVSVDGVAENNASAAYSSLVADLWSSTSAITSINLTPNNGTSFVQYSTAYLYGVSNA